MTTANSMTDCVAMTRTVGHGVIYAYAIASLSLTAMVLMGFAPWGTVVAIIAGSFLFVGINDHLIQRQDMAEPQLRTDGNGNE